MTETDLQLLLRAKNQIKREATWRSFLIVGIVFAAVLRLIGFDLPYLYFLIFTLFFVSLLLTSDLLLNIGTVTKRDLVGLIENTVHNDPAILSKYANLKDKA
ncbi:MAG: hypothetical protein ACI95C_000920 [Pseudohongiellaceae bacterium]|jgi:hypothetical protein